MRPIFLVLIGRSLKEGAVYAISLLARCASKIPMPDDADGRMSSLHSRQRDHDMSTIPITVDLFTHRESANESSAVHIPPVVKISV